MKRVQYLTGLKTCLIQFPQNIHCQFLLLFLLRGPHPDPLHPLMKILILNPCPDPLHPLGKFLLLGPHPGLYWMLCLGTKHSIKASIQRHCSNMTRWCAWERIVWIGKSFVLILWLNWAGSMRLLRNTMQSTSLIREIVDSTRDCLYSI